MPVIRDIHMKVARQIISLGKDIAWLFVWNQQVEPTDTLDMVITKKFNVALKVLHDFLFSHLLYLHDDILVNRNVINSLMPYDVATCVIKDLDGKERLSIYRGLVAQPNPLKTGYITECHPDRFFMARRHTLPYQLVQGSIENSLVFSNVFFVTELTVTHLDYRKDGVKEGI